MTATVQRAAADGSKIDNGRTTATRRVACSVAMLLAPWGFVITNTCYLLAIRGGGSDENGAAALSLYAAQPGLVRLGSVAGMIGCLLLVPAVLGLLRAARNSWLVFAGGALMIAGYVCYLSVLSGGFVTLAMAERGDHPADYAAVIDAGQAETGWVFLIFVVGNLGGTAVLASGLLASRAVPVWAALGILAWPPLHIIGLIFFGNEVPQVIGAVLQALGFAGCAVALLRRRPS
ncbi:hypothetical protein [Microlunatus parietis]|uniref:DUF4386 domain-containing protein n=1 Tax=Microlunatus parietis TaxID=682979 RepID=A0A7Y9I6V9_9ACTN|nr:hypothetical protein [Microlunatus parietis]NYE71379.1 hypothetical protein [Microlunatus parietis]